MRAHITTPSPTSAAATVPDARMYLSTEQLTARTPWSVEAIDKMIQRSVLVKGIHFFQLRPRSQRLFKWTAIVELIEGRAVPISEEPVVDGTQPKWPASRSARPMINVEKATTNLQRLLD